LIEPLITALYKIPDSRFCYALACFRRSLEQKTARYAGAIKLLRKTSPSGKMMSVQAIKKPVKG
jgi:hypothetical protein